MKLRMTHGKTRLRPQNSISTLNPPEPRNGCLSVNSVGTLLMLVIGSTIMDSGIGRSDETNPPVTWAIAIHGGAGGDPAKWDDAKIKARKRGSTCSAVRPRLARGWRIVDGHGRSGDPNSRGRCKL